MELEILGELQPAIGVRQRERALDVVGSGLAGGVREVVERQYDFMVAPSLAAVFAPIAHDLERTPVALARHFSRRGRGRLRLRLRFRHGYHLLVFMLWICACRPLPIAAVAKPISWPYLRTVSPFLMSLSAILWPSGTASTALTWIVESSSSTQPVRVSPAFTVSTTTTPTVSCLS